jgi:N-acetylmuramoyl-L-alanine amidase
MKQKILVLTMMLLLAAVTMAAKRFTLVIDAGHGGHDAGAVGAITKEKTINLNVALAFGRLVEQNCPDVKVIYTRKTDVFVHLDQRANIANKNKADLFISIHTNALPKGRISRGLETYTLGMHRANDNLEVAKRENEVILYEKDYKQRYQGFDPRSSESYIMFEFMTDHNMAESVELAKFVQRRTCAAAGRQNKGVKQAGFLVLRATSMPSCLIELGFISTPDEERYLNSAAGVEQLARGIYQAFVDYKRKHDGLTTNTVVPEPQPEPKAEPQQKAEPQAEPQPTTPVPASPAPAPVSPAPAPVSPDTVVPAPVAPTPAAPAVVAPSVPVYKVQILASAKRLAPRSAELKGHYDAECYVENGLYKYTLGSSTNYQEINRLRRRIAADFPQAFIVSFVDGKKVKK